MPASKAQQKAVAKYMKENYDIFQIRMPKGKKEIIKKAAEKQGKSLNSFVNEAIDEKLRSASDGIEADSDRTKGET